MSRASRNRIFRVAGLFAMIGFWGFMPRAGAAVLKAIQTGTTTIAAGSSSQTVAITAVDLTKAFLTFGVSLNTIDPENGQVSGQISATNQLTFQRFSTGTTV